MTPQQFKRLDLTCRNLERRLQRQERMSRRLAAMHGLTIEELEAEESLGVLNGWPHTWAEHSTWCRLNGIDA